MLAADIGIDDVIVNLRGGENSFGMDLFYLHLYCKPDNQA